MQTGAVEILHRDAAGDVERIAILGPRERFGKIAIFTGTPRSASVVALVETSLLRMSKAACEQLVVQWFFPYQLDVYQIAYFGTGEQGFSHAQGRRLMAVKLVVSLVAVVVSVPWWRAIGLIR